MLVRSFFFLLSLSAQLFALDVVTGQTAILEFSGDNVHKLQHKKKTIALLPHPTKPDVSIAFVPVPYRQKSDMHLLHVKGESSETIRLHVKLGNYKQEQLKVASSKVKPPKSVQERIRKEYHEAMDVYHTFRDTRYWNKPFVLPMQSKITSTYGTARVFNGSLKSFHSGTDFRAAVGTPVHAVNDGVVVIAKERYYAGGSVVIDHGEGIYSCYYHLSEIPVKVGQKVTQEEVIGLSGQSGRVTGPHLHFSFMVQGVQVDPMDLIGKINALF